MAIDTHLLGPVFALAAWTGLMLLMVAGRRLLASAARQVSPGDFRYGESPRVPPKVTLANRNYMNLLELPVLFYVACLAAMLAGATSAALLALAWAYVALRILHSLIHITYNHVLHRFLAFAASNGVLIAMWVLLALRVF